MQHQEIERLSPSLQLYVTKTHKFGTDAFLLSAFAKARRIDKAADFGTGCGIVALLWYRIPGEGPRHVTCVDIQPDAIGLLCKTVTEAGLTERVTPLCRDIRELGDAIKPGSLHLVTVNPPYKAPGSGIPNADDARQIARHETMGTLEDICAAASRCLRFGGRLCLCQRPERLADTVSAMKACGIEPKRLRFVTQRPGKAPWLFLMEGKKGAKPFLQVEKDFIIEGPGGFSRELLDIYGKEDNLPR